jgi:hypothetical protein
MKHVVSVALVLVGIIHLLPLPGVLGRKRLESLYGISIEDPNLMIVMRHRAVLFAILGAFFLVAALRVELQALALILGFVSVMSFLWLARSVGGYNAQVARVYVADLAALALLVIGACAYVIEHAT